MPDIFRRSRHGGAIALLAIFLCLLPASQSAAMTAEGALADGNRLFRDDLYWAALLRYRQASEAGMDTPLLHYNVGIAHYRAGQHIRARKSLMNAAQSPGLRVLSQYNLGLNAYAGGDIDDALNWFRQARDQEENRNIRRLATIAISRLQAERRAAEPQLVLREKRQVERKLANLDLRAQVGFGTNDNVFRSPSQVYVDFSDPALPLVTPDVTSGVYIPIEFNAKYSVNSLKFESFYGAYRLAGRYYQDQELDNANEFSHEIRFGSEFLQQKDTRERRVFSAFTFAQHDETYYDPDDGSARAINGESIDDRMNYVRYGPELALRQSGEHLALGLRFKGQLWNYEENTLVPEYDHEYFVVGANVQYRFTASSLLRLTIDKYSRRYGDRPAFDLNGQQLVTNPDLRYDYLEVGFTARQRITNSMWFGFNLERTERTDRFLGYNDYTRDQFGVDYQWSPGARFSIKLTGYYRNYDFPNAFAFHNPLTGTKTLESIRGKLVVSYRMTPRLSLIAEAELRESTSTDTRIGYDRNSYSLGITWQR